MSVISIAVFIIFRGNHNWEVQEVIGYISIVLSLLFVFVGIRYWRDHHNQGNLSFMQGLKLGTLITLFPSIAFGFFTWLEMNVLDPGFSDKYYNHYVDKMKATVPPEKLQATLDKLEAEKEMFSNPVAQFGLMFLTVFLIGIVITVISTLILRRESGKSKFVTT